MGRVNVAIEVVICRNEEGKCGPFCYEPTMGRDFKQGHNQRLSILGHSHHPLSMEYKRRTVGLSSQQALGSETAPPDYSAHLFIIAAQVPEQNLWV